MIQALGLRILPRPSHCLEGLVLVATLAVVAPAAHAGKPAAAQQETARGSVDMPEILEFKERLAYPLFVSAERVLLPDGSVDGSLFDPAYANTIAELLAHPAKDGCIDLDWSSSLDIPPAGRSTLADGLRESDNIFVGTVTGRIFGFYSDRPGVLIRLSTGESLKGGPLRSEYYVFFPVGTFKVGKHKLCKKNASYPKTPQLNDELLVLFDESWFNGRSPILSTGPSDLITLPRGGRVVLPELYDKSERHLRDSLAPQVLERVRRLIEEEGGA